MTYSLLHFLSLLTLFFDEDGFPFSYISFASFQKCFLPSMTYSSIYLLLLPCVNKNCCWSTKTVKDNVTYVGLVWRFSRKFSRSFLNKTPFPRDNQLLCWPNQQFALIWSWFVADNIAFHCNIGLVFVWKKREAGLLSVRTFAGLVDSHKMYKNSGNAANK